MQQVFRGKAAIITGGGRGVGRAVAEAFAGLGAGVVISARKERELEACASSISRAGGRVVAVPADVGDPATAPLLLKTCLDSFGACDVLINGAGVNGPVGDVEELDLADWNETFRTNMTGTFLMCRAVVPQMKRQQRGRIINASSGLATRVQRGRSLYSASKAAVAQFTRVLAEDVKNHGILANAVHPGLVDTGMVQELIALTGGEAQQYTAKRLTDLKQAGQLITPAQSAELFVWLAAGTERTGEFVFIDDPAIGAEIKAFFRSIG